jgi:hypothetical protein
MSRRRKAAGECYKEGCRTSAERIKGPKIRVRRLDGSKEIAMGRFLSYSIVLVLLAALVPAQRPSTPVGRTPTPPSGGLERSGAGFETRAERQARHERAREAKERRGLSDRDKKGSSSDTDTPAPGGGGGGAAPAPPGLRVVPRGVTEEVRRKLIQRAASVHDLHLDMEVRTFGPRHGMRQFAVRYLGRRAAEGSLSHRVSLQEIRDGTTISSRTFLIQEFLGEPVQAWVREKGEAKPYVGSAFMATVADDHPLVLFDIMPSEPARYELTVLGQGERDERPHYLVQARSRLGREEEVHLELDRFSLFLLRETAFAGKEPVRVVIPSELEAHDGRTWAMRHRFQFSPSEAGADVRLINVRLNRKLDPSLFDFESFAR